MGKMEKANIKKLYNYLEQNKEKAYPIKNDFLAGATDFIINGYLRMLAVVLQQAKEIKPAQLGVFKRIVAGVKSEQSAEEYLRMALDIEIQEFIDFATEIKELDAKYRFILDAIILTCVTDDNEEQLQLVAVCSEFLGIEKKDFEYIVKMARAIITNETKLEIILDKYREDNVPHFIERGHSTDWKRINAVEENRLVVWSPEGDVPIRVEELGEKFSEIDVEKIIDEIEGKDVSYEFVGLTMDDTIIININCDEVIIINANINFKGQSLSFINKKKVLIQGCTFTGDNTSSIVFVNCEEVEIIGCTLVDFKYKAIQVIKTRYLGIVDTTFKDCMEIFEHSKYSSTLCLGGVVFGDYNSEIHIKNCIFDSCGGRNLNGGMEVDIISNCTCRVEDTKFVNCWSYIDNGEKKISDSYYGKLFNAQSDAINCIFEDSAKFN